MTRVVVVGGGFAGLAAVARLSRARRRVEVVLLDRRQTCDFKPLLPDAIGRRVHPRHLRYPIEHHAGRHGCRFLCEEVVSVDTDAREVRTAVATHRYDYLLLAPGAAVAPLPSGGRAYPLHSAADAEQLIRATTASRHARFAVVGGGYTGVEIATQLAAWSRRAGRPRRVTIIESGDAPLRGLAPAFRSYAAANLARMGVELVTRARANRIERDGLVLDDGRRIDDALVVWSPGLSPTRFVGELAAARDPAGRIAVRPDLSFAPGAFAAGDAAGFEWRGRRLRPSFQFALSQGAHAAANVLRDVAGRNTRPFRPIDLGWVVPMANGRSCGRALGVDLFGPMPTALHYVMCVFRSYGLRNRWGVTGSILRAAVGTRLT